MPQKLKQQLIYLVLALLSVAVVVLLYIGDFSSKAQTTLTPQKQPLKTELTVTKQIEKTPKIEIIETIFIEENSTKTDITIEKEDKIDRHFSCIDFELGSYRLTSTCKQRLQLEFNNTQYIKEVEVIGVVDNHDFIALEELNLSERQHNYIRTLASEGLGSLRANEATWYINKYKNPNTTLKNSSYILKTTHERGFTLNFK
ncbi:MAG: hypothetical protein U9N42_06740 [Campylobacterota bacterium]|nr:hypothetical protein [Campylobacterota bacterium]